MVKKKYGKVYESGNYKKKTITSTYPHREKPEDLPDFIPKSAFTPEQWKAAKEAHSRGEWVRAPEKQGKVSVLPEGKKPEAPELKSGLGKAMDIGVYSFAHPFQSLFAGVNPNITVEDAARQFYGKSLGRQIVDVGLAGVGYGSLIAGAGALAGAKAGAGAGGGGMASVTRTATTIPKHWRAHPLTVTAQRGFVGKPASTGIDKIFHAARPVASRYASNAKSTSLTKGFLLKAGLSLPGAAILIGAIGSYPFAGFIKEEAIQTLSIPIKDALYHNDLEGARMQTDAIDELLNAESTLMDKIPYANVLKNLNKFFEAARVSNEQWKRTIAMKGG